MRYLDEFKTHWRVVAAAFIGMATGTGLVTLTASLFAPALIAEFGWSKADYALFGTLGLPLILIVPVIGWLTDRYGVRRVAAVGIVFLPISHAVMSMMSGSLPVYFGLTLLQFVFGATTAAAVYTRLITVNYHKARGLALSIVASGGAVLLVVASPVLGGIIDSYGWRVGYQALAVFSGMSGLAVLLLIPRNERAGELGSDGKAGGPTTPHAPVTMADYRAILSGKAFWLIFGGICLAYMPHVATSSQFKLVLLEQGLSSADASWLISLYAGAVIVGRFVCGYCLDRFRAHIVAAVALGVPAFGFFVLASPLDSLMLLVFAIALMGVAQGAEIDLMSYMVAHHFAPRVYSSVLGIIFSGMSLFSVLGSVVLSATLKVTPSYALFIALMGVAALASGILFLFLGSRPRPATLPA